MLTPQPAMEMLDMPDAEVLFDPAFFNTTESEALFQELMSGIEWGQQQIEISGGSFALPRLMAWYGDPGKIYHYSGITFDPLPWTPTLLRIKARVEAVSEVSFNSVLLNLYRNAEDSVSWHSDDEPELGKNPVIASVSFGATRAFQFKHKHDLEQRRTLELASGSLLLMRGTTQQFWKHQIPRSKTPCGQRINLTFRVISGQ